MPGNWCPAARPASSRGTQTVTTSPSMRGCERGNGDRGVCGRTTSTSNRVVSVPVEVLIPESLDPLQKFKVISDASETDDAMID